MSAIFQSSTRCLLFCALVITLVFLTLTSAQAAPQVTLAWDPNTPAPDGYQVFQRLSGQHYDYSSPVWPGLNDDPKQNSCTIKNLEDDTSYYFVVRAHNGNDVSSDSNEIQHTTPPAAPLVHAIAASAGPNGTISPVSATVTHGGNKAFTITPDQGYEVSDVLVDGQSVGQVGNYLFTQVTESHDIRAIFKIKHYTLTATAGPHGTIDPPGAGSVAHGASRAFTITPHSGYRIAHVTVDGVSAGAVARYVFSAVNTGHTISAGFAADTYTIAASSGTGGSISPAGLISLTSGSHPTFHVTADEGYEIAGLTVDGRSQGAVDSYTFDPISANHTIEAQFRPGNHVPVADAGPDQVVDEQSRVTLSGLNSMDLDDGLAAFEWLQVKGTPVIIGDADGETTTFTAPDVGANGEALEFQLTVTDASGAQASDRCIVNVTWVNEAPRAQTGDDRSVDEGGSVVLDASRSMDPDDGIDAYQWRQIQGPEVVLSDPQSSSPDFTAPDVGYDGVTLIFELTVSDQGGLQDTDRCRITVTWHNEAPLADAGPDRSAHAGNEVQLDGSLSRDSDGVHLNYQWRQTFGPPAILSDATSVRPVFTVPMDVVDGAVMTFALTVTDSGGLKGTDTCRVELEADQSPNDATPPTLTVEKPVRAWSFVFRRRIDLMGRAEDNHELTKVLWKNHRGGSGVATGTARWQIEGLRLYRGRNVITVTAVDAAGNQYDRKITVYRLRWRSR